MRPAPCGRYSTPRNASGMSATMMSALKMTAERMALWGVARRMMFSACSSGYVTRKSAGMIAKYFAIIPALFLVTYPELQALNIMRLATPQSAILSAVIFNALIIVALIPLALRGVEYRPHGAGRILRRNLLLY